MSDSPNRAELALLEAEAIARRRRLTSNVDRLSVELRPRNLLSSGVAHARHAAHEEAGRARAALSNLASDMMTNGEQFVKDNRAVVIAGAALALGAAFGLRAATRKRPVPLYEAWNADGAADDGLSDDPSVSRRPLSHARDRAVELGEAARHRAAEAARVARQSASDAGEWVVDQQQAHPYAVILAGLALGALAGVLAPRPGTDDVDSDWNAQNADSGGLSLHKVQSTLDQLVEAVRQMADDLFASMSSRFERR